MKTKIDLKTVGKLIKKLELFEEYSDNLPTICSKTKWGILQNNVLMLSCNEKTTIFASIYQKAKMANRKLIINT